jgi:hypothetical protein
MAKSAVLVEFDDWKKKYNRTKDNYKNMWADIGHHPLDHLFFDLASIYYRASPAERTIIEGFFSGKTYRFLVTKKLTRLLQLVYFVRRVAKLIDSPSQIDLVRAGLAIASIEGGRYDFRDTIISLIVLRFAAERNGINFLVLIDTIIPVVRPESRSIFLNVKNHSETDMLFTVRRHGPPGWV